MVQRPEQGQSFLNLGNTEKSGYSVEWMKFDLLVRSLAFVAGLVIIGFTMSVFQEGKLGRLACVLQIGIGVVFILGVLVSNRLKPPDVLQIRRELKEAQQNVTARKDEVVRLTARLSEVLLVFLRWGSCGEAEPAELKRWKQRQLLAAVAETAPSTQDQDRLLRFVRLIDAFASAEGEKRDQAYRAFLDALERDGGESPKRPALLARNPS